jgi:hypothetical protein
MKKLIKCFILYLCEVFDLKPYEVVEITLQAVIFVLAIAITTKPFFSLVVIIGNFFRLKC